MAPLHVAAREGQVAALELLLSRGADIEMLDGHGWTALQVAGWLAGRLAGGLDGGPLFSARLARLLRG